MPLLGSSESQDLERASQFFHRPGEIEKPLSLRLALCVRLASRLGIKENTLRLPAAVSKEWSVQGLSGLRTPFPDPTNCQGEPTSRAAGHRTLILRLEGPIEIGRLT